VVLFPAGIARRRDDNGDDKFKHRTVGTKKGTSGVSGGQWTGRATTATE